MYFEGQLTCGIYTDDGAGIDPEEFTNLYGTYGPERTRNPHQTGAGQLSDEDLSDVEVESSDEGEDESMKGLAEQLGNLGLNSTDDNLPKAARVPKHSSPFTDAQQSIFLQAFEDVVKEGIIPPGYGMLPEMENIHRLRLSGQDAVRMIFMLHYQMISGDHVH